MPGTEKAIHSFIQSRVQPTVTSLTPAALGVLQESGHLLHTQGSEAQPVTPRWAPAVNKGYTALGPTEHIV